MRTPSIAPLRRARWLLAAVPVVLLLAACGQTDVPPTALNDGVYVIAGPITYQLQVSRELNQYATEDRQYLVGLSPSEPGPSASQVWYGVFLWAKNQTKSYQTTASNFDIADSLGNHYYPVALDSAINQFAYKPTNLAPGATEPGPGTTASFGPTGGQLLLFKLNTVVYANRPLTLEIRSPGGKVWGTIALDL